MKYEREYLDQLLTVTTTTIKRFPEDSTASRLAWALRYRRKITGATVEISVKGRELILTPRETLQ